MNSNTDYREKYINYKKKYLRAKQELTLLQGGGIDEFKSMFNAHFNSDWILTGSEAIKLYLEYFGRQDLLTFTPNDVDIIYITKDKIYRDNFGDFKKNKNQTTENSMTFINGLKSFDITTTKGPMYYYEINGIKLMTPNEMYNNYEENLFLRNSEIEKKKMEALLEINKLVTSMEKKRLPELPQQREISHRSPALKKNLFGEPFSKISKLNFD